MRFHVNPKTGDPGKCTAQVKCPFGGDEAHYPSPENARQAFELSMAGRLFSSPFPGHPEMLTQFCRYAEKGAHYATRMNEWLKLYDRDLYYSLYAEKTNTDWADPEAALACLKRVQQVREELSELSYASPEASRKEKRQARYAANAVAGIDAAMGEVLFNRLDENYTNDNEESRARWLTP